MKNILFVFLLFPLFAQAQEYTCWYDLPINGTIPNTFVYRIDSIEFDSLYLYERFNEIVASPKERGDTCYNYRYFQDTLNMKLYIRDLRRRANSLETQIVDLQAEADFLNQMADTINVLFDDKFNGGVSSRSARPANDQAPEAVVMFDANTKYTRRKNGTIQVDTNDIVVISQGPGFIFVSTEKRPQKPKRKTKK